MDFIPEKLIEFIKEEKCALFVGAGLSKMAGGPSWLELLKEPAKDVLEIEYNSSDELVKKGNERGKNYKSLISLANDISKKDYIKLRQSIRNQLEDLEPEDFHTKLLMSLPCKYWVTTNYDHLLEDAAKKRRKSIDQNFRFQAIYDPQQFIYSKESEVLILKLHGDYSNQGTMIITEDDYRKKYDTNSNLIITNFVNLFTKMSFLFLGYSFQDPDLVYLLEKVAGQLQDEERPIYIAHFDSKSIEFTTNLKHEKNLNLEIIDASFLPGEINDRCETFVKYLKKRTESQKRVFVLTDYENLFEERLLVKELRKKKIAASSIRDWPLDENFEDWIKKRIEESHYVFIIPSPHPVYDNVGLSDRILLSIKEGCKIVELSREKLNPDYFEELLENNKEKIKERKKVVEILLSEIHKGLFIEQNIEIPQKINLMLSDGSLKDLVSNYSIEESDDEKEWKGDISSLLEQVGELNHNIDSDAIVDRIFISNASKPLIYLANQQARKMEWRSIPSLKAGLEYARLLRFQGNWEEAGRHLVEVKGTASDYLERNNSLRIEYLVELSSLKFEMGEEVEKEIGKIEQVLKESISELSNDVNIKLLKMLANLYREQGDWKKTEYYANLSRHMSELIKEDYLSTNNDFPDITKTVMCWDANREYASFLMQQDLFNEAEAILKKICSEISLSNYQESIEHFLGIVKYSLGQLYVRIGKAKQALSEFNECLKIFEKYDNPIRISFILDWIGRAMSNHLLPTDLDIAEKYIRKSKRIREISGHRYFIGYANLALGNLHKQLGLFKRDGARLERSMESYEAALKTFTGLYKRRSRGVVNFLLGACSLYSNKEKSKYYFEKAIEEFGNMPKPYIAKIREANFEILKIEGAISMDERLEEKDLEELIEEFKNRTIYCIDDQALTKLKSGNMPNDLIHSLMAFKDQEFLTEERFWESIKKKIKREDLIDYKQLIIDTAQNYYLLHLSELGEYRFHIWLKNFINEQYKNFKNPLINIPVGIGDDAAVLEVINPDEYELVLTTDAAPGSICRSHKVEDGKYAAQFSVIQSISDILAMGATPVAILLNLYLDRKASAEYAMEVVKVIVEEAKRYGVALVGGDVKERNEQSIGCVGMGLVKKRKAIKRNGAKVGHIAAISLAKNSYKKEPIIRKIGQRWAADILHDIENEIELGSTLYNIFKDYEENDIKRNLLFLPADEMIHAAETEKICSAIDTSDGFMSCLQIIGRESNVDFVLEEDLLREIIDEQVLKVANKLQIHPAQFLFNAGHDYEFVMTIEEKDFLEVQKRFREKDGDLAPLGRAVKRVGEFQNELGIYSKENGEIRKIPIFTDEKFVRMSYEKRISEWEELNVNYYLKNGDKVDSSRIRYELVPEEFRVNV